MHDQTNEKTALTKVDWERLSDEWESSGETQSMFCKRRQIRYNTFNYWRSKLSKEKCKTALPRFAKVSINKSLPRSPENIRLTLPNGITIVIPNKADKDILKHLFELLEVTTC